MGADARVAWCAGADAAGADCQDVDGRSRRCRGYKTDPHRKIEVYRSGNGKPFLFPNDPAIVGIASDVQVDTKLPAVHLDDIAGIANLLLRSAMPLADVLARA